MSLSDEERRLLEEMEAALAAEDPRLADTLRGGPTVAGLGSRRLGLMTGGLVVGIALLIGGMLTHWIVSVLGFVVMVAATLMALRDQGGTPAPAGPRAPRTPAGTASNPFMDRVEERWKRRQQGL